MGRPHASPLIASSIIHKGWHILYWLIAILDNIGFTFVCIDDTLDYYWLFLMTWTNQVFIHLNKHANPAQTEAEKKDTYMKVLLATPNTHVLLSWLFSMKCCLF